MKQLVSDYQISSFSRANMLENGLLIDVSNTAESMGFTGPVALSNAEWEGIMQPYEGTDRPIEVIKSGALWDCLWMLYIGLKHTKSETPEFLFPVILDCENIDAIFILKAVIGPDDDGYPVITILKREEE